MKAIKIKSPLSNNYYTNFRVTADGVVEYDLIDARRTGKNISRSYIFRESSDLVQSYHTSKKERFISKARLLSSIYMTCIRLIQEAREMAVKFDANRFNEVKSLDAFSPLHAALMIMMTAFFVLAFKFYTLEEYNLCVVMSWLAVLPAYGEYWISHYRNKLIKAING